MSKLQLYEKSGQGTPAANKDVLWMGTGGAVEFTNNGGVSGAFRPLSSQSIATAAGTTQLTGSSPIVTLFTGSTTQTIKLPDATTILSGTVFQIRNGSTGLVTLQDGGGGALGVIPSGGAAYCTLVTSGTVAGVWDIDCLGYWSDPVTPSKQIAQSASAATASTILTLSSKQTTSQTLSYPNITTASTIAIKPPLQTSLSSVANPTGTTTLGVFMGLGQAPAAGLGWSITPQVTGRCLCFVQGTVNNNTSGGGATWDIVIGTGSAPANGASSATVFGYPNVIFSQSTYWLFITGNLEYPFYMMGVITGLTLNTTYWLDINLGRSQPPNTGTVSITSASVGAFEW
jgi:hypothetical protein